MKVGVARTSFGTIHADAFDMTHFPNIDKFKVALVQLSELTGHFAGGIRRLISMLQLLARYGLVIGRYHCYGETQMSRLRS